VHVSAGLAFRCVLPVCDGVLSVRVGGLGLGLVGVKDLRAKMGASGYGGCCCIEEPGLSDY